MTTKQEPRDSNIWVTLTVLSAAFTILMLLLEGLGVFHDWGLVLSGMGFLATVITSTFAATGHAVARLEHRLDHRLDQLHDTLLHILKILDARLPDLKR
jgi:hypothetical protein